MRKAFIDLDGTLVDSTLRHIAVLDNALKYYKTKLDISDYLTCKSNGYNTLSYLIRVKGLNEELATIIDAKWKMDIEKEEFVKCDLLYSDALFFLQNLTDAGYQNIILTSRNNEGLARQYIQDNIDEMLISEVIVVPTRYASSNKAEVVKKYTLINSIIVGDTEVDYKAAVELGIRHYMLNRGFRDKTYWDNVGVLSYNSLYDVWGAISDEDHGEV